MALKITTLRSNFKKLNESIQQYIAEGKPTQEFLAKLVNLEGEGVLKSCSDAWVLIFQKYHESKEFHFCEFEAQRHSEEFVKFLEGLKFNEQAAYLSQVYRFHRLTPKDENMYRFIHKVIDKNGLGKLDNRIVEPYVRYYDLNLVVGLGEKLESYHGHVDTLRIRFDQECESVNDFSIWKNPIFKKVLSDKQKMRVFELARKKSCDAVDYAVCLGIDLEEAKPRFTDDLLKTNDLHQIRREFNPKIHDQDRVLAHVTELIKKEQNPDPADLARDFLNGGRRHPMGKVVFAYPGFPFYGRW